MTPGGAAAVGLPGSVPDRVLNKISKLLDGYDMADVCAVACALIHGGCDDQQLAPDKRLELFDAAVDVLNAGLRHARRGIAGEAAPERATQAMVRRLQAMAAAVGHAMPEDVYAVLLVLLAHEGGEETSTGGTIILQHDDPDDPIVAPVRHALGDALLGQAMGTCGRWAEGVPGAELPAPESAS